MAFAKDKTLPDPFFNLGNIQREKRDYEKAINYYTKSLAIERNSRAHHNLGITYRLVGKLNKALLEFNKALLLNPQYYDVYTSLIVTLQDLCLWDELNAVTNKIKTLDNKYLKSGIKTIEDPFFSITTDQSKKNNLQIAKNWSAQIDKNSNNNPDYKISKNKLSVGFVSDGFQDFPTGHNLVEFLEKIDKRKMTLCTYSYGQTDESTWRKRIQKATKMTNIEKMSDKKAAKRIIRDEIDILIDLKGYINNNRLGIFAKKPARLQVSWLGYPGTTGASFMDYIIADNVVIPKSHEKFYTEKVIKLPHCYRPLEANVTISPKYKRSDFGLPEDVFVFSTFNALYKIEPNVFDSWVKILSKVPDAILWLNGSNKNAADNLTKHFRQAGIDKNRLFFAKRINKYDHLARLCLADLALDTFITNGHTTTTDNLISAVPVLTKIGNHFNSRVSASCLSTLGLKMLITKTKKEYETKAIDLATNPKKLHLISLQLQTKRKSSPFFDMKLFADNFTTLLQNLYARSI